MSELTPLWECERCHKLVPYMCHFCVDCTYDLVGEPPKPFMPQKYSEVDFPQAKDIEPTVENFSKVLDNKLIRDATSEERESVDNYIKSISTKTGRKFDED